MGKEDQKGTRLSDLKLSVDEHWNHMSVEVGGLISSGPRQTGRGCENVRFVRLAKGRVRRSVRSRLLVAYCVPVIAV